MVSSLPVIDFAVLPWLLHEAGEFRLRLRDRCIFPIVKLFVLFHRLYLGGLPSTYANILLRSTVVF